MKVASPRLVSSPGHGGEHAHAWQHVHAWYYDMQELMILRMHQVIWWTWGSL